jgi:hypothetical protein
MTREAFKQVLDAKGYSYRIEGNKIVVTYEGTVSLKELTSLPPGVVFNNGRHVYLDSLTSISPGVEFENRETVYLTSLTGGRFYNWKGNIEGIDSKRLLNSMISKGLFER